VLAEAFGDSFSLVAEEDSATLRDGEAGAAMLARVTEAVNGALASDGRAALTPAQVLAAIDRGASPGGRTGRHWVLDPVDGTLGFVRGDQYAVALALLDGGVVVAGVLGCPNMPTRPDVLEASDALSYGFSPRLVSKMLAGAKGAGAWYKGCLFAASQGAGAWVSPSDGTQGVAAKRVAVSAQTDGARTRMTEPVLKANSSQSFTASVASALGMASKPLRLYSMVKYGAVARGDADVFMKFPKAGYKEKIWDHAAGVIVVQEAGGVVTDAGGAALDFGAGRFLEHLDRGIVASSSVLHARLLTAVASSWASSQL
jgi:3'(2'), 5'-bisphosphate nucleotidase